MATDLILFETSSLVLYHNWLIVSIIDGCQPNFKHDALEAQSAIALKGWLLCCCPAACLCASWQRRASRHLRPPAHNLGLSGEHTMYVCCYDTTPLVSWHKFTKFVHWIYITCGKIQRFANINSCHDCHLTLDSPLWPHFDVPFADIFSQLTTKNGVKSQRWVEWVVSWSTCLRQPFCQPLYAP